MEEGIGGPPGDRVESVDEVTRSTSLLTVVLARGVHPVDHLVNGVAGLVVAPITVDETSKTHGHRVEVVLEGSVIRARGRVFVNDDFRPVFGHPIVHLPRVCRMVNADQR